MKKEFNRPIFRGQCDGSSELYNPDKGQFGVYEKDYNYYEGFLIHLNHIVTGMFSTDFSGNIIYKENITKKVKPESLEISFDSGKTWKLLSEYV